MSALDRDATPAQLRQLAHDGVIDAAQLDQALRLIDARADRDDWRRFTERTPLFAGVGLVLSGVVYFFAANWAALTRAHQLGLALTALAIAGVAAGAIGTARLGGKVAAIAAALLVGPVLLTFGQAYQTGADAWELFAGWTILSVPFVLAVRGPAIPLIAMVLLRVTVLLCLSQEWGLALDKNDAIPAFLALLFVDTLATIVAVRVRSLASARVFAGLGVLTVALPVIFVVVRETPYSLVPGGLLVVVTAAVHLGGLVWSTLKKDAPLVAILGASTAMHFAIGLGEYLFDGLRLQERGLLLLGTFILCEAGALAAMLRGALRK